VSHDQLKHATNSIAILDAIPPPHGVDADASSTESAIKWAKKELHEDLKATVDLYLEFKENAPKSELIGLFQNLAPGRFTKYTAKEDSAEIARTYYWFSDACKQADAAVLSVDNDYPDQHSDQDLSSPIKYFDDGDFLVGTYGISHSAYRWNVSTHGRIPLGQVSEAKARYIQHINE